MDFDNTLLEEVQADYLAPQLTVPYKLWRQDKSIGGEEARFYIEFIEKEGRVIDAIKYKSVTSVGSAEIPKGWGYYEWLKAKGAMAEIDRGRKAIFGTVFHIEALKPLERKRINSPHPVHGFGYDFSYMNKVAKVECPNCQGRDCDKCEGGEIENQMGWTNFQMLFPIEYRNDCMKWLKPFKKGLLAWFKFLKDRVTNVIAIEIPLRDQQFKIAGTGDLFGTAHFQRRERMVYIDIKSFLAMFASQQKKAYFEGHEFQAAAMARMWDKTFPNHKVTHSFMWSPNNYTNEPTYQWKNMSKTKYFQPARNPDLRMLRRILKSLPESKDKVRFAEFVNKEAESTVLDRFLQYIDYKGTFDPVSKVMDIQGKIEDLSSDWKWEKFVITHEY